MSLTIYGLKTCDTCRKARKELEAAGIPAVFVDVRETPVASWAPWLSVHGESLLNTRSTTWRGLSETERAEATTDQGRASLLSRHPALMKRPLIATGGQSYLGWTSAVRAALLPPARQAV